MTSSVFTAREIITSDGTFQAMQVESGRVVELLGADEASAQTSGNVIDLGPATLVPGLVDAHVHLGLSGEPDAFAARLAGHRSSELEQVQVSSAALARAGVTAARDLGSSWSFDLPRPSQAGAGPTITWSSPPITRPGGHLHFMGGEVADRRELVRLISSTAAAGHSWVKILVNGGFSTPGSSPLDQQFDSETVELCVVESHRLGLRVAAHVHTPAAIEMACRAGVDSLEHVTFLTPELGLRYEPRVGDLIAASGTLVCPTIALNALSSPNWPARAQVVAALVEAGAVLIVGTDAGIADAPPAAYAAGLLAMREIGLSDSDIYMIAMKTGSLLKLDGWTGLRPGDRADFVVVPSSPAADITSLGRLSKVYLAGQTLTDEGTE